MQESFDFAADDIAFVRTALTDRFGQLLPFERSDPVWRLVRSLIGCRTYDRVAEPALKRLQRCWPHPSILAAASAEEVEKVIADVTYPDEKARNLVAALQRIGREKPDYDLSFLRSWPVRQALTWLERLPGVGPKVAAATLNASSLRMRVFIVDTHVHRVLIRFGLIGPKASAEDGRNAITGAARTLEADDFLELFAQMKCLGQTYCRPAAPKCRDCPLGSRCRRTGVSERACAAA